MIKYILSLLVLTITSAQALIVIPISSFPNISAPATNYLIIVANPGITNNSMSLAQFSFFLANDATFVSALLGNTNIQISGSSTNFTSQTISPNVVWTNTIVYWITNVNFTSVNTYTPAPVYTAELIISNSAAGFITNTLPFTAYSISLGGNVTQAVIPPGSMLDLQFYWRSGIYYVKDYGKNNSSLYFLSTNTANGFLVATNSNGTIVTK